MSFDKIEKTNELFNIITRGLGYNRYSDGFIIVNKNLNIDFLFNYNTLTPVLAGMSEMLYGILFPEEKNKILFPTELQKMENSLCFVSLKEKDDYNIENTIWSESATACLALYVTKNILTPNQNNKVDLSNLVNLWRYEMSNYQEGEIIDLKNHRSTLIDYNLSMYPKIRKDLLDMKKNNLRKTIFD